MVLLDQLQGGRLVAELVGQVSNLVIEDIRKSLQEDERQDIVLELGRIGYFHCLTTDGPAQHTQSDGRTRIALDRVFYFQRHVTHDVTLRTFSRPFGAHISHTALKDHLGPGNELIE